MGVGAGINALVSHFITDLRIELHVFRPCIVLISFCSVFDSFAFCEFLIFASLFFSNLVTRFNFDK